MISQRRWANHRRAGVRRVFTRGRGRTKNRRCGSGGGRPHDDGGSRRVTGRSNAIRSVARIAGHTVVSMPPPSSGGAHIIEILNILEGYPIAENRASTRPLRCTRWRKPRSLPMPTAQKWLGDPDFVKVPLKGLVSKAYADHLAQRSFRQARRVPPPTSAPAIRSATRATRRHISRSSMKPATRSPTRTR